MTSNKQVLALPASNQEPNLSGASRAGGEIAAFGAKTPFPKFAREPASHSSAQTPAPAQSLIAPLPPLDEKR